MQTKLEGKLLVISLTYLATHVFNFSNKCSIVTAKYVELI